MTMPEMITANVGIIVSGLLIFALLNFLYSCGTQPEEMEICINKGGSYQVADAESDENEVADYECVMP